MSALGRVVRKGRIRVDARKAMAKLREHLLVDLHLYAIEIVRAAVLAGATRVGVEYDADDVIVRFDGEPLDPAELPRLFEHLVGDPDEDESRSRRLLALAANAALGLDPAWIAIVSASSGRVARVTWTPALVAAIEREEKPLPEVEDIAPPAGMPSAGTLFHLRRRMGWETVRRAAAKTLPREIALLVEAACCLRVPLFVNGGPPPPPVRPAALASAAIILPGVHRARVEIIETTGVAPHVEFCEAGLLLARAGFTFGAHFPMSDHLGVAPPVRIVIDSDALPTNASRSAVREDAPLLGSLRGAAAPALADAIAGLAAFAFDRGEIPEGVTIDTADRAAARDALGAFLCAAEASLIARVDLPSALRLVLDLPHFEDGLGRPMTHADVPRESPLLVWTGDSPVPEEMTPWARRIVWLRGRVAERILTARAHLPPEDLASLAKRGAARRQKLLAMPATDALVPDGDYLARERFAFREGPFAGLTGEVAIASDPAAYVRNLALRVFLEGRCFEAFPMPEDVVPLPCVIALQWPGHITPKLAYEGVEPTAGMRAALAFAVRASVLACERFAADRLRAGAPLDAPRAAVLRAALGTVVTAPTKMYSAQGFEMPALADLDALLHAPVWPTTDRRLVSLQDLSDYAAKTGSICAATAAIPGRAADGRPVVSLPVAELSWLIGCLRFGIALVRYDAALLAPGLPARARSRSQIVAFIDAAAAAARAPILHVEDRTHAYAVTLGTSETRVWHGGVELLRTELDDCLGGVTLAIDDDTIVPAPDWKTVAHAGDPRIAARAERAFVEHLVSALLGDEPARSHMHRRIGGAGAAPYPFPDQLVALPSSVQRYLIDRAERGRRVDASEEDRALTARIELLPFLTMLGDTGEPAPASLATIASTYPDRASIPYLRGFPRFRAVRWHPVILTDEAVRDAFSRWSGGRAKDAGSQVLEQERRATRESALAGLRASPPVDPRTVGPAGDPTGPLVYLSPIPSHGLCGVAAALPLANDNVYAHAEILLEDRLVCAAPLPAVTIPVVARVSLLDAEALDHLTTLTAAGAAMVSARVETAALALALDILERARTPGKARTFFSDQRALRVILSLLSGGKRDARSGAWCETPQRNAAELAEPPAWGGDPDGSAGGAGRRVPPRDGKRPGGGGFAKNAPLLETSIRHFDLKWPTVQGEERCYAELAFFDGALWIGTDLHASWLPPPGASTDLDRPILHLAPTGEGALLARILERLNVRVRPVTAELAALQHKRAQGSSDRPRLAVRPVDPRLAQDLHTLQLTGIEGEIALYDTGESFAEVTALNGDTRRIPLDVGLTARAVARVEILTTDAIPLLGEKLSRAAVRLLLGQVPALDDLPAFVRAQLRALTCRALAKDRDPIAAVRRAPLFPDIDGHYTCVDDILTGRAGDLHCTFDPPPYPRFRQDGRTLVLTPAEHLQLTRKVKVLNVTEWMRRDLEAERRRESPEVPHVRLDAESRARLLAWTRVDTPTLEGEIGLLAPASTSPHGIHVLTTRRPVCTIDDAPGWPITAVVNDDTLHPTRWFDALLPGDETALRARVRAIAARLLRETLEHDLPPERDRLSTLYLDEPVPPAPPYGSTDPITITGPIYLPSRWPESHTARILIQNAGDLGPIPILLASAPLTPTLPLGGSLCLSHGAPEFTRGAACRVALFLRGVVERMLAPLLQSHPADPELLAYQWNLRLLGALTTTNPTVPSAAGTPVTADDLIGLLHSGADLWLTDRAGTADGVFPQGTPPFVLLDDGSPLLRVLRARLPAQRFRHLGATSSEEPRTALAAPSVPPPPDSDTATFDASATRKTTRSWLSAVLGRVTDLLSGPRPETAPTGIAAAVERALRALRLREEPVLLVEEVHRGKLVRYDESRRAISINISHPALAPHVASPSPARMRRVYIALVTAALSEVNIALEHVTDHDESQALLELLRQESAADKLGA